MALSIAAATVSFVGSKIRFVLPSALICPGRYSFHSVPMVLMSMVLRVQFSAQSVQDTSLVGVFPISTKTSEFFAGSFVISDMFKDLFQNKLDRSGRRAAIPTHRLS